jgi:hypothetical protein
MILQDQTSKRSTPKHKKIRNTVHVQEGNKGTKEHFSHVT